jgi:tetratricopeptide (TPR) repeat protein
MPLNESQSVDFQRREADPHIVGISASFNVGFAHSGPQSAATADWILEGLPYADLSESYLWTLLGDELWEMKEFEGAIMAYEFGAESDPEFPAGWHKLAHALRERGFLGDIVAVYNRAIEYNPYVTYYLLWLGDAFYDSGDHVGAIKVFRKYIESDPKAEPGWVKLARVCHEIGDWSAFKTAFFDFVEVLQ